MILTLGLGYQSASSLQHPRTALRYGVFFDKAMAGDDKAR